MRHRTSSASLAVAPLFLVCFLWTSIVGAQKASTSGETNLQGQIDVTANKVTMKPCPEGKEIIFEGKVTVKHRDITLLSDRLIVLNEEKKGSTRPGNENNRIPENWQSGTILKTLTALGNVKINQKDLRALAGKACYDHAKRTVTLTEGPPRFWQPGSSGITETIIMYLDDNSFELFKPEFTIDPPEAKKEKEKQSKR